MPLETLNQLYAGIVEPHFSHCCSVWGCCGVTEENDLQKLQNRAARIITIDSFDAPGIPLLRRLGWKTVEEFIAHELELMVFKSLHGLAPQYVSDLFTKISQLTSHNLRIIVTDLWPPQKRSSNGLKSFSYRGAKTWNNLPVACWEVLLWGALSLRRKWPPPREIESDQILHLTMLQGTKNDANTFTTRNYRKLETSCVRTVRQSI